jgi:Ca2+-transporting ATPase
VKETIELFATAGIRTVMITGDQKLTAEAVARELGILKEEDEVLDARTFARLGEDEIARAVEHVAAFSRVSPEDKLTIVSACQSAGEIVAVLGDGVNDAPALKKADVGVAMGKPGTDVARETAAVVLQDDRFQTIGAAVEEGRVIFDNIHKFVFYLFSCNLAEVGVLLIAGIAGLPVPLLPLQILWLNFVTDTFPALALAVDPPEPDIMRRAPRNPREAILSASFARSIAGHAALITGVTLAAFLLGLRGGDDTRAVTMSFMTLALAQAFHLANARGERNQVALRQLGENRYAIGAVGLVVGLQILAINLRPLANLLRIEPLSGGDWLVVVGLAVTPAIVGRIVKVGWRTGARVG